MELTPLISPDQAAVLQRRWEDLERLSRQQAHDALAYQFFLVLFAAGAALLLAWVFWPRHRLLTWSGWREESADPGTAQGLRALRLERGGVGLSGALLLLVLSAISHQVTVDRHRGFIDDRAARMERELLKSQTLAGRGSEALTEAERQKVMERERENILGAQFVYLPKGSSLRYLSLGNEALAADYIWLTSLQYVASPLRQGARFGLLYRFYDVILDLDPHWSGVHTQAGRVLSALDPNRRRAETFFVRAICRNPDDYQLPLEAGLHYIIPPTNPDLQKDYSERASFYLRKALQRPTMPPEKKSSLEHTLALLENESGQHVAAARRLWGLAGDPQQPEAVRDISSYQWLQADSLVRVQVWQGLVNDVAKRRGRFPQTLREALSDGLATGSPALRETPWLLEGRAGGEPVDAFGLALRCDPATGKVRSRGVMALRAIQYRSVLEPHVGLFAQERGRLPSDMKELSEYVRQYYIREPPLPFTVTEAFGSNLDCTKDPLDGEGYRYDPQTGHVVLPPFCAPAVLRRNERFAKEGRTPPYFQ